MNSLAVSSLQKLAKLSDWPKGFFQSAGSTTVQSLNQTAYIPNFVSKGFQRIVYPYCNKELASAADLLVATEPKSTIFV
jgi:hypothetical protein